MKLPKQVKRYCPYCKKHTLHKVSLVKPGRKRGALSAGQRRFKRVMKGYRGFPRPKVKKGGKYGAKVSRKVDLRFRCSECKKAHVQRAGVRTKRFELK
jgi:large subunit ribosomal protein L44e